MSKGFGSQKELDDIKTAIITELMNNVVFPPLTGSEKQIAWAEKIREKEIAKMVEAFALHRAWEKTTERGEKLFTDCMKIIPEITEAKTWIDDRFAVPGMLAKKAGY